MSDKNANDNDAPKNGKTPDPAEAGEETQGPGDTPKASVQDDAGDGAATEQAEKAGWEKGPEAQIEALSAEAADLKDKLLRAMAEMENVRRRAEREREEARKYAVTSFARDMLAVGDNMSRAVQSLGKEARENTDETVRNMIEGVEMTEREMINVFERHGISKIEPAGEKFDPNFHQAMFEIEKPDVAAGTVVDVVAVGYLIGERVLRPAMVGVSKGGPKAAPKAAEDRAAEPQPGEPAEPDSKTGADDKAETAADARAAAKSHRTAAGKKTPRSAGGKIDKSA